MPFGVVRMGTLWHFLPACGAPWCPLRTPSRHFEVTRAHTRDTMCVLMHFCLIFVFREEKEAAARVRTQ